MQGCSINDERCYTSGGSNLEGVTQQQSQAVDEEGLASASSACDDEPQCIGAISCEMSPHSAVHIQLCSL